MSWPHAMIMMLSTALGLLSCARPRAPEPAAGTRPYSPSAGAMASRSSQLIERARVLLARGQLREAAELARAALGAEPDDAAGHTILAAVDWGRGELLASRTHGERAFELEPTDYAATLFVARALQTQGHHREAIELLDHAYEVITREAEAHTCSESRRRCTANSYCDLDTGRCLPAATELLARRLISEHLLLEVEAARATSELLTTDQTWDDPFADYLAGLGQFAELLVPHQPLMVIEGERGVVPEVRLDTGDTLFVGRGRVEGVEARVGCSMFMLEATISEALADELGLAPLGSVDVGMGRPAHDLVVLDQLDIGGMVLRRIPAFVAPLGGDMERVVLLGRQLSQRLGALTYDLPASELVFERETPAKPAAALELTAPTLAMYSFEVVVVPVYVGGTRPPQWVWLSGGGQAPLTLSPEALHGRVHPEPRVEDSPLLVVKLRLGARAVGPLEVEVVEHGADAFETLVHSYTGFPVAGSIKLGWLTRHRLTHIPREGLLWVE